MAKNLDYALTLDNTRYTAGAKQATVATKNLQRSTLTLATTSSAAGASTTALGNSMRLVGFSVAPQLTAAMTGAAGGVSALSSALKAANLSMAAMGPIMIGLGAAVGTIATGWDAFQAMLEAGESEQALRKLHKKMIAQLNIQAQEMLELGQITAEQYTNIWAAIKLARPGKEMSAALRSSFGVLRGVVDAEKAEKQQQNAAEVFAREMALVNAELDGPEALAREKIIQANRALVVKLDELASAAGMELPVELLQKLEAQQIEALNKANAPGTPGKGTDVTALGKLGFVSGSGSTDYNRRSLSFQERTAIAVEKMYAHRDSTMVLNE